MSDAEKMEALVCKGIAEHLRAKKSKNARLNEYADKLQRHADLVLNAPEEKKES